MLLAGDIGGTKTLLGIFAPAPERPRRDRGRRVRDARLRRARADGPRVSHGAEHRAEADRRGVLRRGGRGDRAGRAADQRAVAGGRRRGRETRSGSGACGSSTTSRRSPTASRCSSRPSSRPCRCGVPLPDGNAAVIAAGTGLGEAMLHNVDGRFIPAASEGGHADFAARTPREMEMVRALGRIFGRVGVELVISGPGLVNIYQFTHDSFGSGPTITPNSIAPARLCEGVGPSKDSADLPARISQRRHGTALRPMRRGVRHLSRRLRRRSRQHRAALRRHRRRLHRRRDRAEDPAGARVGRCSWTRSATRSRWRTWSPRCRCR